MWGLSSNIVIMKSRQRLRPAHAGIISLVICESAGLYKEKHTISLALRLATGEEYDRKKMLQAYRKEIFAAHFMKQIVKDITSLFDGSGEDYDDVSLMLWDNGSFVDAGINYGDMGK